MLCVFAHFISSRAKINFFKYFNRWCDTSLIVDGKAVVAILKSMSMKEKFSTLSSKCRTVVACRLAPVQKSQLVRMIKESSGQNVTAAIGDGGNDISMIQGDWETRDHWLLLLRHI